MTRKRTLTAGLLAVVAITTVTMTATHAANSQDDEVRQALVGAIAAEQSSFAVPDTVTAAQGLAVGKVSPAPPLLTSRPDAAKLEQADRAGRALLGRYFGGEALAKNLSEHARMMDGQADSWSGFTPLGGGVSHATFGEVDVDGNTATVKATVTTWARMSQVGPDGSVEISQPSNDLLVDATLAHADGLWKVIDLTWTFAPGSEP